MPPTLSSQTPAPASSMPPQEVPEENTSSDTEETGGSKEKPIIPKRKLPDVSNVEWAFVLTFLLFWDVVQFVLIWLFGAGLLVNSIIDVGVGFVFLLYCFLRGLTGVKQIASIISVFGLEFIPAVNALPFWILDGIVVMMWYKAELKLEQKVPLASEALRLRYMKRVAGALPNVQARRSIPPAIGGSGQTIMEPGEISTPISGNTSTVSSPQNVNPTALPSETGSSSNTPANRNTFTIRPPQNVNPTALPPETGTGTGGIGNSSNPSTPSRHVVNLRNNPQHERNEGNDEENRQTI